MRLFVCWTTKELHIRPGGHPCANAYKALREAGHDPEIVKTYSFGAFPGTIQTKGRKDVHAKTGSFWVPVLETDAGEWIGGSNDVVAWAEQHPATAGAAPSAEAA